MSSAIRWLDEKLYPSHTKNWDDTLFRERILSHLSKGTPKDALDLGAGAGIVAQMNFKRIARRVCGVDPDARVVDNPQLDEGRVGFGESIPYADGQFDVVFADNVLEHLPHPEKVFAEVFRVLRQGGVFLAKTPNKWHYMPTIARMTPFMFHQWLNRTRGRDVEDTFPTRYLANTPGDIQRLAARTGFTVETIDLIEGRPEYLRFSTLSYLGGWMYERLVNITPLLSRFRIMLVAELRKL
jgi:SAM-dependent methyltransferase